MLRQTGKDSLKFPFLEDSLPDVAFFEVWEIRLTENLLLLEGNVKHAQKDVRPQTGAGQRKGAQKRWA
jgi:hypothetical protein